MVPKGLFYDLFNEESFRSGRISYYLRWVIILTATVISILIYIINGNLQEAMLNSLTIVIISIYNIYLHFQFKKMHLRKVIKYLSSFFDVTFISLHILLYFTYFSTQLVSISGAFSLYFIFIYLAALRFDWKLTVIITIYSILCYNVIFLLTYSKSYQEISTTIPFLGSVGQLIKSAYLLVFGLLMLYIPILSNRLLTKHQEILLQRDEANTFLALEKQQKEFFHQKLTMEEENKKTLEVEIEVRKNIEHSLAELNNSLITLNKELQRKGDLDTLIAENSKLFISTPYDHAVNHALENLCRYKQADRTYLFLFLPEFHQFYCTHTWNMEDISSQSSFFFDPQPVSLLPTLTAKIRSSELFKVDEVNEMPESNEKELYLSHDVKSFVAVPVIFKNKVLGFIGFDSILQARKWEDDEIQALNVTSEIIAGAYIRKEAEKALKASESNLSELNSMKDKFFSIIAHDLKNPFGAINSVTEALIKQFDNYDDEEKLEVLQNILDSSKNAHNLLDDLLQWSRSQTGKITFNPQNVPLNFLIGQNIMLLKQFAEQKSISIQKTGIDDFNVFADPNILNTILRNLISNAVKFTPHGGHVNISASLDNRDVLVSIIDNGVGIPPENIKKLFRIDTTISTKGTANEKGTGLGLIISKEFIEKQGGRLWIESTVGKGSIFRFSVPLA